MAQGTQGPRDIRVSQARLNMGRNEPDRTKNKLSQNLSSEPQTSIERTVTPQLHGDPATSIANEPQALFRTAFLKGYELFNTPTMDSNSGLYALEYSCVYQSHNIRMISGTLQYTE
ncbi:hypothetical protein B0O99DRAFT_691246 [Bisporella sp. PMI_857]|nr:hypothetical protein B0O99DRAFT_691246 [Bisporella sp. PMI_857]